jgi:type IV pilus assembly protein PilC
MRLQYKAIANDGKALRGFVDAINVNDAANYLKQRELTPIQIKVVRDSDFLKKIPGRHRIKTKDLVLFTRQLSSMLTSGLTLIKSLEIIKNQTQNKAIQETLGAILLDLQEGTTLSDAISKFPEVFPPIYISLVKAGETSGVMDEIFIKLANNMEKQQKLRGKIKAALTYPVIVVTLIIVVIFIMMIFVVPQLTNLYISMGVELPFATRVIVNSSSFVAKFWPLILGLTGAVGYAFVRWKKTPKGRLKWDGLKLKMPIVGKLISKTILAQFSSTFGLLVGTGTLVIDALHQSAEVTGNLVFENAIAEIGKRVEKGVAVGEAMTYYPYFPPLLIQLVKVGEETGKMDQNLLKASEYFEEEVDGAVKNLTTALEPLILVFLGVTVGFLVFAVISPIYGLLGAIR